MVRFDYHLPPDRVASYPSEVRDESRLLVVPPGRRNAPDRPPSPTGAGGAFRHLHFRDLPTLLREGDLLVMNESRVLPARLLGRKPTGAAAEILLVRPRAEGGARPAEAGEVSRASDEARLWEALVRPGGKLKPGRRVVVADDLSVDIVDSLPGGARLVRLETPLTTAEALARHGHVPLPPYIEREDEPLDRERYQTVYARVPGSVAAPTAGLHFTEALLEGIEAMGVRTAGVTLHVGIGTFRPVEVDDPADHEMHRELYVMPERTARLVDETRQAGGAVWAVGTTVVRTLESVATVDGRIRAGAGSTDLFIRPPFDFRVVDGLVTNFHLPRSTLLMLVAAFAGYERTMAAYAEAVREGYRFYSYGDAMVVPPEGRAEGPAPGG